MHLPNILLTIGFVASGIVNAQDAGTGQRGAEQVLVPVTISPVRSSTLVNRLEGRNAITRVLPEGTAVSEGDLVCTVDTSEYANRASSLRIELAETRGDVERIEAAMKSHKVQDSAETIRRQNAARLADLELTTWSESEYVLSKTELEGAMRIATAELEFARFAADANGLTRLEKLRAAVDIARAETQYRIAQLKLRQLDDHVHPRRMAELEANLKLALLEVEGISVESEVAMAALMAEREAKMRQVEQINQLLDRTREQIEKGNIHAPHDGVLVYSGDPARRTNGVPLRVGQEVRERQPLFSIHDISQMQAIGELAATIDVDVKPGKHVEIQVDAFPNRTFSGQVSAITSKDQSADGTREIHIALAFDGVDQLRPGMTALAVIQHSP